MTQPYPAGFQGPAYVPVPPPRFRPLRGFAIAAIALILGTTVLSCIHTVLFWTAFDDLEVDLAEALNDDDADGLAGAMRQTLANGLLSNLTYPVALGAAVVFLVWLNQARENTAVIAPTARHRLSPGWVIGSWFCPGVQFWFPLTIVDDICRASSEPGTRARGRGILYGWWAAWALYWLTVIVGCVLAMVTMISWSLWISQVSENGVVDDVRVRTDIVRFVHGIVIGLGIATALLAIAGVLACLMIWRITRMQDARGPVAFVPAQQPTPYSPQFLTYGRPPGSD
jgi:Domain of unknown function (DUF4328)